MTRSAPRYQGRITTWKDEQGYGFITPNGGGPAVFVHIKSFAPAGKRPSGDEIVTYHRGSGKNGQPRAENVQFVRVGAARSVPARRGNGALYVAALFIAALAAGAFMDMLPWTVPAIYFGMSTITFVAYAIDKSAARHDRWRTPESTLHFLALAGGWPGASVAQRLLRHKSSKETFHSAFQLTVLVNCALLAWLLAGGGIAALETFLHTT